VPATSDFRLDILYEAFGGTAQTRYLSAINTVCLSYETTTGVTDRKCATLASGDYTLDLTAGKLTIKKSITNDTGSPFTYNRVALKSGTKYYFLTPVTETTLPAGSTVNITWELTVSVSVSASGAFASGDARGFRDKMLRILANQRGAKDSLFVNRFSYLAGTTVLLAVTPSNTKDDASYKLTSTHGFQAFTASGNMDKCYILNDKRANDADTEALLLQLSPSSPIAVDTSMSISHTLTVTF
jgi:hypothetical protein